MQIPLINAFFDELEKIATIGEAMPGSGRAGVMQRAAGTAQRALNPPIRTNDTGKAWMARQMGPGGALTSPAQSAAALAARKAPSAAVIASKAAPVIRGARVF